MYFVGVRFHQEDFSRASRDFHSSSFFRCRATGPLLVSNDSIWSASSVKPLRLRDRVTDPVPSIMPPIVSDSPVVGGPGWTAGLGFLSYGDLRRADRLEERIGPPALSCPPGFTDVAPTSIGASSTARRGIPGSFRSRTGISFSLS